MPVNRENIRKWVDALESGRYTQGAGELRTAHDTYCCLGVACDVSGLGIWVDATENELSHRYTTGEEDPGDSDTWVGNETELPKFVKDWLGLISGNPMLEDGVDAVQANDCLEYSFGDIAAALRARYLSDEVTDPWGVIRYVSAPDNPDDSTGPS